MIKDKELVHKLVSEDPMGLLGRSLTVQVLKEMGREEGLERGRKEGLVEARQSALLDVLRSRFGKLERGLDARILRLKDAKALKKLIARAAVVPSLRQFAREIPR